MRKAMRRVWGRVRASLAHMWESRAGRSAMILAAVLAVGCVFLWWLPKRQVAYLVGTVPRDVLFQRENEARQTWAGIIGGLVVLATLYFTWRRLEVAQETQVTERFTRAIEQLGSEKLEVRLGGIYALERIARDSAKDHWPTMEVLTACVRENATRKEREAAEAGGAEWPPADIQAILTVIGRRRREFDTRLPFWINLSDTHLENVDVGGGDLEDVFLLGTHLEGALLASASLEGAHMHCADLHDAVLSDADLRGVDLSGVNGLTREQIESAITDETTVLPDYLKDEGQEKQGEEGARD